MIHKTTRSILSVLLAALLLVTSIPLTPAFAGDGGAVSLQSESGEGRALKPADDGVYQIATAEELWDFAELVNDGETDANAILTADIDLNDQPWYPIGTSSGYSGNFNGDDHTISGLYIKNTSSDTDYQGFFGYVGSSGKIENLSVSGSVSGNDYVGGIAGDNRGSVEDCDFTGSVSGNNYVGGVVGLNRGSVINCTNTGSVKGSGNRVGGVVGYNNGGTVKNCYNTGNISGNISYNDSGNHVGGVVGYNSGSVENCHNIGSVSGNSYVGGVVGVNSSTVKNCYNTGSVKGSGIYVGGVVGNNGGSVTNCYNTGEVSGNYVGGVVGMNNSGDSSASASVTNCYNTGTVTGNRVGGVVGYNISSVTNCYNTGSVTVTGSDGRVGGVVGLNSSSDVSGTVTDCYFLQQGELQGIGDGSGTAGATAVKDLNELCEKFKDDTWTTSPFYNHPVLQANPEGGLGTATHPYEIKTIDQLETFRNLVNRGGAGANAHAKLMNDIDLNGNATNQWTPIGNSSNEYSGTFNGNGKTISGLYIDSEANYQGLFGYVYGGTVKDLTVSGNVSGSNSVGGVVGYNFSGTVTNCAFSGSVSGNHVGGVVGDNFGTVENCYNTDKVSGSTWVGGVVGYNGGPVKNCYNTGAVNSSGSYVGGVVGQNSSSGTVENCHNIGEVSGSGWYVGGVVGDNGGTVENCYNTGSVSGTGNRVGGVVGYNSNSVVGDNSGSVENCYNTGNVSGGVSGGVVGYNDSSASGSVTNCYNTGSVSDGTYTGGVVGQNISASVANCYYQTGKGATVGIGNETTADTSKAEGKTDAQFASGEVAYLLQSKQTDESGLVWGQNLMNESKDNYPQLRAFDADTPQVYKVAFMNDSEEHDAKYANNSMTVGSPTTNPTKEGYTFAGWKDENDIVPSFPITVSGNLTYYAKWTPHTYSITASPSALDFGSITEGEERPAAQRVTVKNTGNQTVTLKQPTAENFEITTSDNLTLNAGKSVTLTIQPKASLPRGSYSEQITITDSNNVMLKLTATFTVKEPPYTGKYSYEVSTSVGDHGSLSVDRYATEGDKVTIDVTPDQAYKLDDLSVTAHGKDVELTANSDGTYTFTMPSADVRITATFAEDPDWTPDEPEEPSTDVSDLFIDIAPDAWYKDAIQYAYDNGLMTGVSATEFDPEATTTRAMIVSILARLENVTTAEAAGFADVDDNDWYATAVNWAANVGVVNGYEDNTFKPNTAITREQLAAILMNYAAYKGEDVSNRADLTSYTDQPSTWAEEAISWSVAEGLLTGVTADTLQPQGAATRAQVAAILQRFLSE